MKTVWRSSFSSILSCYSFPTKKPRSNLLRSVLMASDRCCTFLEILLAIVLPPLGVFLHFGCCSMEFCICLLLTILGYVPGIIYAVYVLVALDSDQYRRDYYAVA